MKLYSFKSGDQIYYVPAKDYTEAVEQYRQTMGENAEPEKITLAAGANNLIAPRGGWNR